MYARSITIEGSPESVDARIEFVEQELRAALADVPGWRGFSLLVNRETGRAITTTSWETEADMHASSDHLAPLWERTRAEFGSSLKVEEWEVALMHRVQRGTWCRVAWFRAFDLDQARADMRSSVVPMAGTLEGFAGASLLVDKSGQRGCSTTSWASREASDAASADRAELRERAYVENSMEVLESDEFELVIAELGLPESS